MEWVIERLIALLGPIAGLSKDKRELGDNALRSISHALNETYLYYRDIEKGTARNLDSEAQLSRYWAAASIPIRHIDRELADICEYKSQYWVSPESWANNKIVEMGIELNTVRERYKNLLKQK